MRRAYRRAVRVRHTAQPPRVRAVAASFPPDVPPERRRLSGLLVRLAILVPAGGALCAATRAGEPGPPTTAVAHDIVTIGRSVEGRPIRMHIFGDGPDRILVLAGVHGDEPAGTAVAARLIRELRSHPELSAGHTVAIIPAVNPDGLRRHSRANARGVDLNRNFPSCDWRPGRPGALSHGLAPCSEPETAAVARAVVLIGPDRIVDIHSISGRRECNNYDGPGQSLAALMSRANGYPVAPQIGYPTPGCLGSWTGIDDGIPTVTLELPRGSAPARCWAQNQAALVAFVRAPSAAGCAPESAAFAARSPQPAR